MNKYIILLRGINVGGKNVIKMADLKEALIKSGLSDVKTYIQSGNIICSSEADKKSIQQDIEEIIKKTFGLSIPAILRTQEEFEKIIKNNPFSEKQITDAKTNAASEVFYVSLFNQTLTEKEITLLKNSCEANEHYFIVGQDVYLLFSDSIRNSKLGSCFQKIKIPYTIRNWNTINKLFELSK